jgi:hypothetical protein
MLRSRIMSKTKSTSTSADPAALQHQKTLERQRQRAARTLLKRRRRKSGQ